MNRILICDDDEAITEMIKIVLENEGYKVNVLPNSKAIKKKVREFDPSLILIDLWMPGMDGKEAIKLLKSEEQIKNIPIFIVSALHENEVSGIVKQTGAQGYLLKPFDLDQLLDLVQKYAI